MMAKDSYIPFCEQQDIPLFLQPWWLDAVTKPDNKTWDVLLARNKNDEIEAVLPFVIGSRYGLRYALTPQLTQYTGLWIADKEGESITDRLGREKALQNDILQQLGAMHLHYFDVRCPLSYTYWLPFYWAGYAQHTQYTYRINHLADIRQVFAGFSYAKQKQIRKAQEAGIVVDYDMTADELYDLQCTQLSEKGSRDVLSRALVQSAVDSSRSRKQGLIARAKDADGNTHAAIFVVWDKHSAWELISAIHPAYRASGASTLVVWEAMQHVADKTQAWDFEGSMIEAVENSFRQFGAVPSPYFCLHKADKLITIMDTCRK